MASRSIGLTLSTATAAVMPAIFHDVMLSDNNQISNSVQYIRAIGEQIAGRASHLRGDAMSCRQYVSVVEQRTAAVVSAVFKKGHLASG